MSKVILYRMFSNSSTFDNVYLMSIDLLVIYEWFLFGQQQSIFPQVYENTKNMTDYTETKTNFFVFG